MTKGMKANFRPRYSFREYLLLEEGANTKHEFLDGEIYAMAGGTPEHAALAVAVSSALHVQLRGSGCRVHSSDLRIRVRATGLVTYPDVTVVCGDLEHDPEDRNTVTNLTVVVEVLSPSTAAYDRGEKLNHYKQIGSLTDIVLVAHDAPAIQHLTRTNEGWTSVTAGPQQSVRVRKCVLEVDDIYRT